MNREENGIEIPSFDARIEELSNGLEILIQEDHAAPVVSLQAWCRSGSIHESSWMGAGVSHCLEHMLFKGGAGRSASEITAAVQAEGGYINAYTSFDRTVYWIDAPTDGAMTCLDILCDVVGDAAIPEDEFEREQDVIRREIAMGNDNPNRQLGELFFRTAYLIHPCRHPVIGYLDLFNQLQCEDVRAYYREHYSPDNLFFVIAGDINAEEVIARIGEKLGALSRRRRAPQILPSEPPVLSSRSETQTFPTDLHRERLAWQLPAETDPVIPALDLLASALGSGRSSRLYRNVREKTDFVHGVGASVFSPSFAGQFLLSFQSDPDKAETARQAILREAEEIRHQGITEQELETAKRRLTSSHLGNFLTMNDQASAMGSGWLSSRSPNRSRDYLTSLQKVSMAEIQEVATRFLHPDHLVRVSLLPKIAGKSPQVFAPAKRSEEIRSIELENGLKLLLLRDSRLPLVRVASFFRGGVLAENPETSGISRLMSTLLTKDTRSHSAESLAETIESIGGQISSHFTATAFGVSGYVLRPDLETIIDLLGETLLTPLFLESTVEREKKSQAALILMQMDSPIRIAIQSLRKQMFGAHPYAMDSLGSIESVNSLSSTALTNLHRRLVVGENGVICFAGELDPGRTESLIRSRFKDAMAPGSCAFQAPTTPLPNDFSGIIELTHEKEQAILLIGFRTVDLMHPDQAALEILAEACSDMASRLFIRIRENLGLAYSVGAFRMEALESGYFIFHASTAPEKIDLVQREMLAEIDHLIIEGLDHEELRRAKAAWLGQDAIQHQETAELANAAALDELQGLGWDYYRKKPDRMRSLDSKDLQEVAARYFREDARVIVRLSR